MERKEEVLYASTSRRRQKPQSMAEKPGSPWVLREEDPFLLTIRRFVYTLLKAREGKLAAAAAPSTEADGHLPRLEVLMEAKATVKGAPQS